MTHVVKHSCGGGIKKIANDLWECDKCGEVKTGNEIALDDSYEVIGT